MMGEPKARAENLWAIEDLRACLKRVRLLLNEAEGLLDKLE